MYPTYRPKNPEDMPVDNVVVLQGPPETADEVIAEARNCGAVSKDDDGDDLFWIVYEDTPDTAWSMSEDWLREHYELDLEDEEHDAQSPD